MLFICYTKCGTCRKAKKWLDDNGYEYEERDIKTERLAFFQRTSGQEDVQYQRHAIQINGSEEQTAADERRRAAAPAGN